MAREQADWPHRPLISVITPVYNTDPATWPMLANPAIRWTAFEDLAANNGTAYVVNGRRLTEVNGANWAQRSASWTFPAPTMLGYGDTGLFALSGTRIARIDVASFAATMGTVPGAGTVNGMAVFGPSAYVMRGNCFYDVSVATLTSVSMGC